MLSALTHVGGLTERSIRRLVESSACVQELDRPIDVDGI